jgi:hypothetical protein
MTNTNIPTSTEPRLRELTSEEVGHVAGAAVREVRILNITFQFGDNGWVIWDREKQDPIADGEY